MISDDVYMQLKQAEWARLAKADEANLGALETMLSKADLGFKENEMKEAA